MLHQRGQSPELVAGVDHDPMRLGTIVDAQREPTLYVFCQSEQFRPRVVRQAQGVLGARKGPQDEVLVFELGDAADVVVHRILDSAGRDSTATETTDKKLLRDVVKLPAAARPAPGSEPPAKKKDQPKASWRATKGGGHKDPGARIPGRSAHVPTEFAPQSRAQIEAQFEREHGADLGDVIVPASSAGDEAAPAPSSDQPQRRGPKGSARGPLPEAQAHAERPAPSDEALPSRPPSPAPLPEKRSYLNTFMWLAVLGAVAGTAYVLMNSGLLSGDRGARRGAPGVEDAQVSADTAPSGSPATAESAASSGEALAKSQPAPEGSSEELVAAVESGELRVLDLLYIAAPHRDEWDYEGAEAYCSDLRVGGLPGFRLPGAEELKSIRRAHMLERGRFWSSDPAGDGFAFVLDTDAGAELVRARKKFRGAQPVCVRSL